MMSEKDAREAKRSLLAPAAKYICNLLDGRCPKVIEKHPCPTECGLETLPWHCWVDYFLKSANTKELPKPSARHTVTSVEPEAVGHPTPPEPVRHAA